MTQHREAGPVLQACLHDQREELTLRLRGIPYREHDSVHRARVATRRLRSALRGYAPLLDRDAVESLVGELRWLARALGAARDLEVLHVRLEELLAEEPEPVAADALRTRLFTSLAAREAGAERQVLEVLASDRCRDLTGGLARLVVAPPWTQRAAAPAVEVLPPRVRNAWDQLASRVGAAATAPPRRRDVALHDARKAARHLRYVTEVAEPVGEADARRLTGIARRIASLLGQRQDSLVVRTHLLALEVEATEAGESAFVLGRMHRREEARAHELDRDFAELWDRASHDGRLLAWLGDLR